MPILCWPAKKNELLAELAYWYGIDASQMPADRRLGLYANLPRIRAIDTLREGRWDTHDPKAARALVLAATGDEKRARKEATAAAERLVRRETEAARIQHAARQRN